MKKSIFFLLFFFHLVEAFSSGNVDSLRAIINSTDSDTVKIDTYIELSAASEGDAKRRYLNQALKWAKRSNDLVRIGDIYEKIGDLYYPHEIDSAHYYFQLSFETHQFSYNNKEKIAKGLNSLGAVYWYKNQLSEAISYYLEALEINQKIGNTRNYAINCLNISMIYDQLKEYEKALEYMNKMEAVNLDEMEPELIHSAMNTKGVLLYNLERYEEAKIVQKENLQRAWGIEDSYRIGMSMENLALVFFELGQVDSSVYYLKQALNNSEYRQDYEFCGLYNNLGMAYLELGNYIESQANYQNALAYGLKSDYKPWLLQTYKGLADVSKATRNFQQSNYYLEKYVEIKDSLIAEENQSTLDELEAKYKSKQSAQEIQLLKKNEELGKIALEKKKVVIAQQNQKQIFFTVGAIILLVLVIVIWVAFLAKKKNNKLLQQQKTEIQNQHVQLVEKNNEIIDSLNYAKRLQSAILPTSARFEKYFDSHFVFYAPKSIVSGDFYWLEESNGKIHVAVADCTGHGVPGAMVSVVCSNTLTRVLNEETPKNPADILNKSRDLIINYFSRNEENINDGMDITLLSINSTASKGIIKAEYAGANNPLWVIRNGELLEWKADKQPIGKFWADTDFTNNELSLQKGDSIYVFSDGFQDQFGGDKAKKFKASSLKDLLISMQSEPMEKQKQILQNAFANWRGKLEQIDDVCVLGIKL